MAKTVAPSPTPTILFLGVAAFASSANLRLIDPLLPTLATEFGTTSGQVSIVVTAYALSYGVVQLLWGPIGDRFGKVRLVLIATLLSAAATAAAGAFADSLGSLATLRFVSGVVAAAVIPNAMAFIGDVVPFEKRQPILARFFIFTSLGTIFGQAASGILAEWFGWRAPMLLIAATFVVAAIGIGLNASRNPLGMAAENTGRTLAQGYRDAIALWRRPWVRVVALTVALEGALLFGCFTFVGSYLVRQFGLSLDVVGLILGAHGLGSLAYSTLAPAFIRLIGETRLPLAGGLVIGASYLLLAIMPWWQAAPVLLFFSGLGFLLLHNTLQTQATQMAPESRGAAVSIFASSFFTGQMVGVALAAPVYDRFGAPVLMVIAAVAIPALAAVFTSILQRRRAGP